MKFSLLSVASILFGAASLPAWAGGDTPAPAGAEVYIIAPKDGETVASPVLVQFGLRGMGVAPAGVQNVPDTGHHHLLINTEMSGSALAQPIPADDRHVHFGKGQTEAKVALPPGKHKLQLLVGDWKHVPHTTPIMSRPISITVE